MLQLQWCVCFVWSSIVILLFKYTFSFYLLFTYERNILVSFCIIQGSRFATLPRPNHIMEYFIVSEYSLLIFLGIFLSFRSKCIHRICAYTVSGICSPSWYAIWLWRFNFFFSYDLLSGLCANISEIWHEEVIFRRHTADLIYSPCVIIQLISVC